MVALQWDSSLEDMLLGKVESSDVQLNHICICQIGDLKQVIFQIRCKLKTGFK